MPSGRILPSSSLQQAAKIADGLSAPAQAREALGGRGEERLGVGGAVQQGEQVEDLLGVEAGAFDAQLVNGGFDIGQAAEIDADGCAARGGLRARGGAQVCDRLAGFGQVFVEALAVGVRRSLFQLAAAQRAGDIAAHQLPQGFEFENFSAGFQSWSLRPLGWIFPLFAEALSITPRVPSVICELGSRAGVTHSTRADVVARPQRAAR